MRAAPVALLVAALLVAGCSSGSDDDAPRSTTSTTSTARSSTTTTTVPFEGSTAATTLELSRDDTGLLQEVVVTGDPGLDRVAFVFDGKGFPKVDAAYVDEAVADGSGERLEVAGTAILQVRFEPAATHDLRGERPVPVYKGERRVDGGSANVTEAVLGGSFEGVVTFFVGVRTEAPYRIVEAGDRVVLVVASSRS